MRADYRANYERIAADHVNHWRQTGSNPWQSDAQVAETTASTVALIEKYSKSGDMILDAGCGFGELLMAVKDRNIQGCEVATPYLGLLAEKGLPAIFAELEDLPYPNAVFDVVVATDVLEHVLDVNVVVWELLRVLKPYGYLIVRSPNNDDLNQYTDPAYPYYFVHLRRFDKPGMILLFTRVFGCEVVECELVHRDIEVQAVIRKP